ncbi:MAG: hypothetical protein BGO12_07525 [Verrucomicrobia bacterium 61-8]|nr:MAG: hypothetical protein BGO12_07525 [Verrucomicrobia bacterium 61-8]
MPPEFVTRKQSLLNVLIEGTKRDTKPRRSLFRTNKAVIVGEYFFPSSKHNGGGIDAGGSEERGRFSAEPPFMGGHLHKKGGRADQ